MMTISEQLQCLAIEWARDPEVFEDCDDPEEFVLDVQELIREGSATRLYGGEIVLCTMH